MLTDNTNSPLFDYLCGAQTVGGACTFPSEVVLDANLECTGTTGECGWVDTLRVVKVVDSDDPSIIRWFEFKQAPCVQLTFFANPKRVMNAYGVNKIACADPNLSIASPVCCDSTSNGAQQYAEYMYEKVTLATAIERCATVSEPSVHMCKDPSWVNEYSACSHATKLCAGLGEVYAWMTDDDPALNCNVKIQIHPDGSINLV